MNRFRVVACVCLGLWSLSGCQSLFGSNSSRSGLSGSGPDGGACTKDPQTIKNVMLAPPVCSATNPCPCGTYCSSQTGGNCVADCVDDTWCAPGYACSAFGQCLNASPADGGGTSTTTNPTCPTNSALLDSLMSSPRACQFDDHLPVRSYCNHVKELCDYNCLSETVTALAEHRRANIRVRLSRAVRGGRCSSGNHRDPADHGGEPVPLTISQPPRDDGTAPASNGGAAPGRSTVRRGGPASIQARTA